MPGNNFNKYRPNPFNNLINSYMQGRKYTAEERWDTVIGTGAQYEPDDYESWVNRHDALNKAFDKFFSGGSGGHSSNPFYEEWNEVLNTGGYLNSHERRKVMNWFAQKIQEAKAKIGSMEVDRPYSIGQTNIKTSAAPEQMISGQFDFPYEPSTDPKKQRGSYDVYFPPRDGYTITFVAGLAFQVPEFYILDKATTYEIWHKHNNLRGRVVYIYPNVNRVPDVLDWFGFEPSAARWQRGVLWHMYDNIAFDNETIRDFVKNTKRRSYTVRLSYFQRRFTSKYRPLKICRTLSHLDSDMNPKTHPRAFNAITTPYVLNFLISFGFSQALSHIMKKPLHVGDNIVYEIVNQTTQIDSYSAKYLMEG